MKNVTILIPVFNEEKAIPGLFKALESYPLHKVLFCDGGSTDKSRDLIKEKGYPLVEKNIKQNSIWKTLCLAKNHVNSEFVWIHPVDMEAPEVLSKLPAYFQTGKDYGWFQKVYLEKHWLLSVQAFFLNKVRSKISKNFVWTNAPIIKTSLFQSLANLKMMKDTEGFLEDVVLSDYLKKHYDGQYMTLKIHVDPRRYLREGVLKRIWGNLKIMYLFRFKKESPKKLKQLYI
ncbi:MAG: glycosyltransferase [Halobacteriovoraceae bacterium]|nr:glycosyltransferase [Halobacteriovoraceae bacterium]